MTFTFTSPGLVVRLHSCLKIGLEIGSAPERWFTSDKSLEIANALDQALSDGQSKDITHESVTVRTTAYKDRLMISLEDSDAELRGSVNLSRDLANIIVFLLRHAAGRQAGSISFLLSG